MEIDINRLLLENNTRLVILQDNIRKETKKKNQVILINKQTNKNLENHSS